MRKSVFLNMNSMQMFGTKNNTVKSGNRLAVPAFLIGGWRLDYVLLLRGANVSSKRKVQMKALKIAREARGFHDVFT
ncbi:DUF1697 domain-containing protein [Kurthia huakuii]|uniref:DUF1697 domain-containing protein n=1 Tax=Kurthia huakuii TaxID=1421019 RepID=UPI000497AD4E